MAAPAPTGAIFRTEFGTVVVQEDICNGCGYCVPGKRLEAAELLTAAGGIGAATVEPQRRRLSERAAR